MEYGIDVEVARDLTVGVGVDPAHKLVAHEPYTYLAHLLAPNLLFGFTGLVDLLVEDFAISFFVGEPHGPSLAVRALGGL